MQWLRNLLSGSTKTPKTAKPKTFQPSLEALDSREMPSVSSALTSDGTLYTYIVDNANNLLLATNGGAPALALSGGVRTAQAFQTPGGSFGVDIIYTDGRWQHFENPSATPSFLKNITGPIGSTVTSAQLNGIPAGGQILDIATAYDSKGNVRLDVVIGTNGEGLDQTGRLFEFNTLPTGTGGFVAPGGNSFTDTGLTNIRWISDYSATNGMTGIAWGTVTGGTLGTDTTPGTGTLQVLKFDVVDGFRNLYQGTDQTGGGITEYSQTVMPTSTTSSSTTTTPPRVVIDVTYDATSTFTSTSTSTSDPLTMSSSTTLSSTFDPTRTYSLTFDSANPATASTSVLTRTIVFGSNVVKPGG
jgi:hypothetical protein